MEALTGPRVVVWRRSLLALAGLLSWAAPVPASASARLYKRMMPGQNFASHNLPEGGCAPVVTANSTSPSECQAACDRDPACDMFTFVPVGRQPPPAAAMAPYPWCCLKACRDQQSGSMRGCPPPNREPSLTSGVKNTSAYGVGPPPPPPPPCMGPTCFQFAVDWGSGNASTSFPTLGRFGVRKVEAFFYPPDGKTYAYADIVNYTCATYSAKNRTSCAPGEWYYPDSYSTEVGVFSSSDGMTGWVYHGVSVSKCVRVECNTVRWVGCRGCREGWQLTWWWSYLCRGSQIVVARGPAGSWDAGGIASPGAAAAADGTVILGYAAENSPSGGINRGIGVAIAKHPLGPFVKQTTPIASPHTICGGTGRCDDVIMQTRPDGVHLYHSVKGSNVAPGSGIRHRMTTNGGESWSESKMVLSTHMQPSTDPAGVDSSPAWPPHDSLFAIRMQHS
jgi:hypothetical protein